jgi:hypothetical protein
MSKDEALKLALDYIVATNKSSEFWLVPGSNLNKTVTAIKEALAQPPLPVQPEERYFCQRCGKRRGGDVNYIHTCTPPQENT